MMCEIQRMHAGKLESANSATVGLARHGQVRKNPRMGGMAAGLSCSLVRILRSPSVSADCHFLLAFPACGGQPQQIEFQQSGFERQLLVVYAQLGQPEQRVELELQRWKRQYEQQQPLQRSKRSCGSEHLPPLRTRMAVHPFNN